MHGNVLICFNFSSSPTSILFLTNFEHSLLPSGSISGTSASTTPTQPFQHHPTSQMAFSLPHHPPGYLTTLYKAPDRFQQRFWIRGQQQQEAPQCGARISTTVTANQKRTTDLRMRFQIALLAEDTQRKSRFSPAAVMDRAGTICAVAGEPARFKASFLRH